MVMFMLMFSYSRSKSAGVDGYLAHALVNIDDYLRGLLVLNEVVSPDYE